MFLKVGLKTAFWKDNFICKHTPSRGTNTCISSASTNTVKPSRPTMQCRPSLAVNKDVNLVYFCSGRKFNCSAYVLGHAFSMLNINSIMIQIQCYWARKYICDRIWKNPACCENVQAAQCALLVSKVKNTKIEFLSYSHQGTFFY